LSSLDTLVGAAAFLTFFAVFAGQISILYSIINSNTYSLISSISANIKVQEGIDAIRGTNANEPAAALILDHYVGYGNYTIARLPLPENISYNVLRIIAIRGEIYYIGAIK
jgi:hypothetical protein